MNRNTEMHYKYLPDPPIMGRSKFDLSKDYKSTCNVGELIPCGEPVEVYPGETHQGKSTILARMTTPVFPVMDNCYIDTYYFFVPSRLLWTHWQEFFGESPEDAWENPTKYQIPEIDAPSGGWTEGTIADYMQIPTKTNLSGINHLPFRGYVKIWNDWFRDVNNKDGAFMNYDETTLTGTNSGDYVTNAQLGALPLKVAKFHDYFTTSLKNAQRAQAIPLPIGNLAPVYGNGYPLGFTDGNNGADGTTKSRVTLTYIPNTGLTIRTTGYGYELPTATSDKGNDTTTAVHQLGVVNKNILNDHLEYSGLVADLSNATGATVNQLRIAFQLQKFAERSAIYGNRYTEYIRANFSVASPDARLQRSEYLGGSRRPINMTEVLQTSATGATGTPQGNVAGYSCTINTDDGFVYSATEHGYLYKMICFRCNHSYQQGLSRMWSRKDPEDFYIPLWSTLGEQAVLNKEIYADGSSNDDEAFGYQERFAELRQSIDGVTGLFRSNATGTLDTWHYADNYASLPTLSSDWIDEPTTNMQRTLAIQNQPQFIFNMYTEQYAYRIMPVHGTPGLIDHH